MNVYSVHLFTERRLPVAEIVNVYSGHMVTGFDSGSRPESNPVLIRRKKRLEPTKSFPEPLNSQDLIVNSPL